MAYSVVVDQYWLIVVEICTGFDTFDKTAISFNFYFRGRSIMHKGRPQGGGGGQNDRFLRTFFVLSEIDISKLQLM